MEREVLLLEKVEIMKKIRIHFARMHYLWAISVILLGLITIIGSNGGGDSGSSSNGCPDGYFSCGDPAGGPACCPIGDSCCFGYNVCCDENEPHLGVRRSDGEWRCYETLEGEGVTWDLLTVCGKPA
jgi:hypothetical protein